MSKALPPREEREEEFAVLEVGAGTGAVSMELARSLDGRGRLDLCEVNPDFVAHLRELMREQRILRELGERVRVLEADVRGLSVRRAYNVIVSGLPFNNFTAGEVREFLECFRAMLKPKGSLAYFEYLAVRKLHSLPFVGREMRARLREVAQVVRQYCGAYQYRQVLVPLNLPPARVRYLRFD
jgi:phospholipid N-methyltransferase